MPIAHVCLGCGTDLSRRRALPEPIYGFRLVRCPTCGRCAVRRPPPLRSALHAFLRLDAALTAIGFQTVLLILALVATTGYTVVVGDELVARLPAIDASRADLVGFAMATLIVGIGIGAWLEAGFGHVRRGAVFAGFLAVAALATLFEPIVLETLHDRPIEGRTALQRALALGCLVPAAMLGVPLGRALRVLAQRFRRWRFGWRRRRRRSLRLG